MKFRRLGLGSACVHLALAVVGLFVAAAIFANSRHGRPGVTAAAAAASVSWFTGTFALVTTATFRDSPLAVQGLLIAIILRLTLPLTVGWCLERSSAELADAGVFGWIVAFYLATLAIETALCLSLKPKAKQGVGKDIAPNG